MNYGCDSLHIDGWFTLSCCASSVLTICREIMNKSNEATLANFAAFASGVNSWLVIRLALGKFIL